MSALLAHALGSRSDLPLPLPLFLWGAGLALVVSFIALRSLWGEPRLGAAAQGRPAERLDLAARVGSVALQLLGSVLYGVVVVAAVAGVDDASRNIAPVALYVVFWVGLQIVSALVGDVYRSLSPFETAARLLQLEEREPTHQYPAAAMLLGFAWLELCYADPSRPRVVALALGVHLVVLVAGMARRGRSWLRAADPFGALFSLLALLSPFGRDDAGRLVLRAPGSGLTQLEVRPGTLLLIQVALAATGFDGLSRSTFWQGLTEDASGWGRTAYATVGLVAVLGIVVLVWDLACSQIPRFTSGARREGAPADARPEVERFAHSLVPIALAYSIAHYFSTLVFEGQGAMALLSDPFGRGWDLFGTAASTIDYTLVSTAAIAFVQAGAIILGHIAGVVVAHDRAVESLPAKAAARSQHPLLVAMVAYTVGGLALLLGA